MHCRIHQITPPKLGWRQPPSPFPRPNHLHRPSTHTLCFFSVPLISQLGLWHAPALFCIGRALGLTGVSSFDPPIPGSTGGHGFKGMQMSNFSRFVPLFKTTFFVFCQRRSGGGDQRAGGEAERAPQTGAILLSKVGG